MKPRMFTVISNEPMSEDDLKKAYALQQEIDVHDCDKPNENPNLSDPAPTYLTLHDVPVPLRHTLRQAHASGLTIKHIATVFELPDEWVEHFTQLPYDDSTENN